MHSIARVNGSSDWAPPSPSEQVTITVTPDPAQGHKQIGALSADALVASINSTADDVSGAGKAVVEIATQIMREAEELSAGIRRCGVAFAGHIQEFAQLAQQVSDTMRSTRTHVLGDPAAGPPEPASEPPAGA
jgi:hypothetical protein